MSGFRGRALIYPALLIAGWIVGRSISLSATPAEPLAERAKPTDVRLALSHPIWPNAACPMPLMAYPTASTSGHAPAYPARWYGRLQRPSRRGNSSGSNDSNRAFPSGENSFGPELESFRLSALPSLALAPTDGAQGTATPPARQRRLQFYSYNFWRQGSIGAALAPNAQYGGSQYGAIATWDPLGSAGKGPALLLRGSGTPDGLQQEVAVGARWQPDRKWPVSLSVERRFRFYGPDGVAAYVAGGVDRVPLVGKLALDAYGQAGYSLGGISSPFVDAQARVQHPLASPLGIPVRIGAGAWIGGQKGAYRADVGPTLTAQVDNRFADFTLQVDWRKRVVGNAAPIDGLALTVSTDF